MLKVGWLGLSSGSYPGENFRGLVEGLGMEFLVLSTRGDGDLNFQEDDWKDFLPGFDILMLPIEPEAPPYKGVKRKIRTVLASGKPLVVSMLGDLHSELIDGCNAFIARNQGDWETALTKLRDDARLRSQLAENSLLSVRRQLEKTVGQKLPLDRRHSQPLVAFYVGSGLERWDESSMAQGLGGSETAVIHVSRELARKGYQVKIFADPARPHRDVEAPEVEYLSWREWPQFARRNFIDYLVCSRTLDPLQGTYHAYRVYVWIHDTCLNPNPAFDCRTNQVDAYFCLSDWHREFVHQHHRIPLEKIVVTHNGIDPARFDSLPSAYVPGQVVYSSSPDRGLDNLVACADSIGRFVPDFKIKVAYGFDNWEKTLQRFPDREDARKMQGLKELLRHPRVDYLGRLGQRELAAVQKQSGVWLYPTNFHETNCITAIEAGYAGAALLTTDLAGLKTTVSPEGGILLAGDAASEEYREKFVEQAVKLFLRPRYRREWAERARTRMAKFTWKRVGEQWHELFSQDQCRRIQP